jgi:acetyl-CoA synthetase
VANTTTEKSLEAKLEEMLETEQFDPPSDFKQHALLNDPSVYDEADQDWKGWWMRQAKELHWFKQPNEDVDESNPPFYKWFSDGKINASYNCLDRHVEAGNGNRVAYHWRGEEGEERDVTYGELLRDTQKLANALKDLGSRRATWSASSCR